MGTARPCAVNLLDADSSCRKCLADVPNKRADQNGLNRLGGPHYAVDAELSGLMGECSQKGALWNR
jgi:hypothetical protein